MSKIKVGSMVRVIDCGEEYPNYEEMLRYMVKKYELDDEVVEEFRSRDLQVDNIGIVVAIEHHFNNADGELALIVVNGSYYLINFNGITKASNIVKVKDKDFKVGDKVIVCDNGSEYSTYIDMVHHMYEKYGLHHSIMFEFHQRDLRSGEEGEIIAINKHLSDWSEDILALVSVENSINLIGVEGLAKIK